MNVLNSAKNNGCEKKLFEFTNGIEVDQFLGVSEIKVQKAWVNALCSIHLLSESEGEEISKALDEALCLMSVDKFEWRVEDEDIHMNLERFIVEKLGEVGKRVHLGRSRNDLIATTLRLFIRDSLQQVKVSVASLVSILAEQAEKFSDLIVPGMTHLQHAQPIRISHILLGYGFAFSRDLERLEFAQNQAMSTLPLGSAALSGTNLPVDLAALATELGFKSSPLNSYDSVGDRDFILEGLNAISFIAVHLSRISEDFIIWSSTPVGLLKLPKNWSTGSSIMPNKRNPDVPELIRAKSGHLMAAATNALFILKGLPSSYNSDLHELKGVFLRSYSEVCKCLEVFQNFLSEIEFDTTRAKGLLNEGHILATEIANALARQGVPFRVAYQRTAALVEVAEARGLAVDKLDFSEVRRISPELNQVTFMNLSAESAVEARNSPGGTSLQQVLLGIKSLKARVKGVMDGTNSPAVD